ncbi:GNAT family N-acetyltransferase [Pseudomonas coleopterorum]|uniref:GNAT family N-acetyltransferase n=1 Tax=Pseudomonas coleopterorum TaxID=1605838 RepID=A0ABR9BZY6_9PSED|nr:GNAT family N-acetyltransferase [Pseudomonas coleopterorum]MBD8755123.1 GNAT family N-acetyltransferase [Pseudomonas coleopterorum]MBD8770420.1 GNAT family N-acetyltransferase [Pseudomonas coleopterorum]
MSLIHHSRSAPSEDIKSQLLQMVVDYLTDISSLGITPSNPLYQLYQYGVGYEVHQYLEAMSGGREVRPELVLALDEAQPETLDGFALFLRAEHDPSVCTVAYMAVRASKRRRGVARALLDVIEQRHAHVELACVVSKVSWFENMGFQVIGAQGPQVKLSSDGETTDQPIAVLDVAPIYASLEVRQIHAYLLNQHGRKAMLEAEKKRDRQLDHMTRQAATFARDSQI